MCSVKRLADGQSISNNPYILWGLACRDVTTVQPNSLLTWEKFRFPSDSLSLNTEQESDILFSNRSQSRYVIIADHQIPENGQKQQYFLHSIHKHNRNTPEDLFGD